MTRPMSRRQALGTFGSVSLAALLAACGDDDSPTTATPTGTPTPRSPEAASTPASDLASLFDESASIHRGERPNCNGATHSKLQQRVVGYLLEPLDLVQSGKNNLEGALSLLRQILE